MANQYTIQQAAEMTQVSAHTLRYYERIGLLKIARSKSGHRRYSDEDLGWVHFILLLRGTDMPLPDIAAFMRLEKDGQQTINKRMHMLEAHRETLTAHIAQLQAYLGALDAKIDYYQHTTDEICDCVANAEEHDDAIPPTGTNGHSSQSTMSGNDAIWESDR